MPVTEKDRDVLARTLWGEARGRRYGRPDRRGLDDPQSCVRWKGKILVG